MGTDGALVASAVFKTVCVHVIHGWLGSIPRRSRNLGREMRTTRFQGSKMLLFKMKCRLDFPVQDS